MCGWSSSVGENVVPFYEALEFLCFGFNGIHLQVSVKNNQEIKNSIMESDEGIDDTAAHFILSNIFANG